MEYLPALIGFVSGICVYFVANFVYQDFTWFVKDKGKSDGEPSIDHHFSPSEDFEIAEEDEDYLAPHLAKFVAEYLPVKLNYPSNAMLIEHLGVSLGDAKKSFVPRRTASDDHQVENEPWLRVAAWAFRLYMEGTPHNSPETLDRFMMIADLSKRELEQYARRTMNQAGKKISDKLDPKEENEQIKLNHPANPLNPYTDDEVEDLKRAQDKERGRDGKD